MVAACGGGPPVIDRHGRSATASSLPARHGWWRHAPDGDASIGAEEEPTLLWTQRGKRLLPPGWQLTALYLGFPVWWALGLANFILPITAFFMALGLLRRRPVALPRSFGIWLFFLLWVLAGVFVLGVEAPGAVQTDGGIGRYMTYGYRVVLYFSATVALLYVGNLRREEFATHKIVRLLGYMFVVTTVGGLIGSLLPPLDFRSPVEYLLPAALQENAFLTGLVHPRTAEVQTVLGYAQSRPVAPFNYANAWGSNYSFFLPFFVLAWFGPQAGWRRRVAPLILIASFVPVVYSLNRGLWSALGLGIAYVVLRLATSGRIWAVQALVAGLTVSALVLLFSPLLDIIRERLANPHSNERRAQLFSLTWSAVMKGSPLLGFGTTRNVQGSFASIAGGESASCRGCGVPPLGTQGALWSVLFFQGLVGLALFLLFFALWMARHVRDTSPLVIAVTTVLVLASVEMFVYDFNGSPLFTVMVALGLVWRERRARGLPS
jgi:hypothetical protein